MSGSNSDVELLRQNAAPAIWAVSDVSSGVKASFLVTLYRILSAPVALNPHTAVCQWQHGTLGGPSIQPLTHLIRQSLKGAKHVHVAYTPPIFTRVLFFVEGPGAGIQQACMCVSLLRIHLLSIYYHY